MIDLGFLGPEGSFCSLAAKKVSDEIAEYSPYQDISSLTAAVKAGKIDKAILPIENSLEGAVNLTLDLLVEFELKITGEVVIPVEHNLIIESKISLSEVNHLISHPHALAQCRSFLTEELTDYQTHTADSTAKAVKLLKTKGKDWAAIGTREAADYYDKQVINEAIQDNKDNWTRFIILSETDNEPTGIDKTSIICSPIKDKPGALYEILQEFAEREINLTRIESRPAKKLLGDYIFFIDFIGHREDKKVKNALTALEHKTSWYKFLGSYPRSTVMETASTE